MNTVLLTLPAALAALTATLPAQTIVTLEPSKDNTLYEQPTGVGNLSNGKGSRMFIGQTFQGPGLDRRRALVEFDVRSMVPRCSQIVSVDLTVTMVRTISLAQNADLHRATTEWGEGTSVAPGQQGAGGPATPGDATWIHAVSPGSFWTNPGGDFVGVSSGTTSIVGNGTYTWTSTAQMVADVQSWVDAPADNHGWIILGNETLPGSAKTFGTKDDRVTARRPQLQITYNPPQAAVTSNGQGCNGSGASPLTINAVGLPIVPNPAFKLQMTGGPTGAIDAYGIALTQYTNPIQLGQCFFYIDFATFIVGLPADANRELGLPVPNAQNLLGAQLEIQGFSIELPSLISSNALTIKMGL